MNRELPAACIVIPCYNEETRLPAAEFVRFAEQHPEIHFRFVNDGSSDATGAMLQTLAARKPGQFAVLGLSPNGGKAAAVRAGVLHAAESTRAAYIGFWDADLATPLEEIPRFLAAAGQPVQCVIGSRIRHLGSEIGRNWHRHYFGRAFATLTSLLLDLPVYDTQCGAKLMHAGLAKEIFKEPFITKWLFDVELLARIIRLKGRDGALHSVIELPLRRWHDKEGSKVSLATAFVTPWQLFLIYLRYRPRRAAQNRTEKG